MADARNTYILREEELGTALFKRSKKGMFLTSLFFLSKCADDLFSLNHSLNDTKDRPL